MVEAGAERISLVLRRLIRPVFRIAALVAASLAFHTPASAELTLTTEDGFVSRHEVVVEASPTETWLALISPSGWWRAEHTWSGDAANLTLTPQAGGCFCETIPEVDEPGRFTLQGSVEHMRVIQAYPEQALRMQGALGPLQSEPVIGILTITISKAGSGTRIVWEYNVGGTMRYEVPVIGKAVDAVMGAQIAALGKLLGPVAMNAKEAATQSEAAEGGADGGDGVEASKAAGAPTTRAMAPPPVTGTVPKPATSSAPKTAPTPAPKPAPKPTPKPATNAATVGDAFGDLEGDPQT